MNKHTCFHGQNFPLFVGPNFSLTINPNPVTRLLDQSKTSHDTATGRYTRVMRSQD